MDFTSTVLYVNLCKITYCFGIMIKYDGDGVGSNSSSSSISSNSR